MPYKNVVLVFLSVCFSLGFSMSVVAAEDVIRVSEVDARKLLVSKVDPEYPAMAKQMRLSGKVQVDCFIDPNGAVEKVQILNGNPLFSSSITIAMKKWKFKPVENNGKAASAVVNFAFDFKL